MIFYIPYRLKSEANLCEHWTARARRHRKERTLIALYMRNKDYPVPCVVSLTRISPRSLDLDNVIAAFKNFRDVVSDFILSEGKNSCGRNDSNSNINFTYHQEVGKPKEYAVKIEIMPLQIFSNLQDQTLDVKTIVDIIHAAKKIVDMDMQNLDDMDEELKKVWQENSTKCLNDLKLLISIPTNQKMQC